MNGRGWVDGSKDFQRVCFRLQVHLRKGAFRLPVRLEAVRLGADQVHLNGILKMQRAGIRDLIQPVTVIHAEQVENAHEAINPAEVRHTKKAKPLIEGIARIGHHRQRPQEGPRERHRPRRFRPSSSAHAH